MQQVAEIKTVHDGMGSFLLTAKDGEIYTAKWKDDLGNSYQTKLPAAKESGATFKIGLQATARSFLITTFRKCDGQFSKIIHCCNHAATSCICCHRESFRILL